MTERTNSWATHLLSLVHIICTGVLFSWSDRSNFSGLIAIYGVLFLSYLLLLHRKKIAFNYLLGVSAIAHVSAFFFMPNLSPDSYRFLWDGAITWLGENPFDQVPNEFMTQSTFKSSTYLKEVYANMSDLSRKNFTCYPTINQFYFVVANTFSESITINLALLKLLILGTQVFGLHYLWKLLCHFQIPQKRLFILALNPLWLIETLGNLHFEGVMFSFLIIGFYLLVQKRWLWASLFVAFAIQIKLIPLVLLPFLLRYLGWSKSLIVFSCTGILLVGLSAVYLRPDNYFHFLESLQLYFQSFEFNSLIYPHYLQHGHSIYGYFPIRTYGARLSQLGAFFILSIAFYGGKQHFQSMITRMIFGLLVNYLFATTVHPWYIITILGLSIFTRFSFGIVWSALIFMTYAIYSDFSESTLQWIIHLEYAILLLIVGYELLRKRPLLPILSARPS